MQSTYGEKGLTTSACMLMLCTLIIIQILHLANLFMSCLRVRDPGAHCLLAAARLLLLITQIAHAGWARLFKCAIILI